MGYVVRQITNTKIFKEILVVILLLLLTYPALKSLLIPGGFTTHDMTHHIVRQIDIDKLLKEGQFPPRWSGDLAQGYGYPIFMFYYPLPALIGHVFHSLGLNFLDSVKAVLFLSFVASTLGMYFFLKALFKTSGGAFLGAIFFLYNPIHLIVVYVSGSPGAAMGLVFPPFICWAIVGLWQQGDKRFLLLGSLSLAGLILSHNITAFVFAPVLGGFALIYGRLINADKRYWFNLLKMVLLGLGLSAFFWVPAMIEKQYIRYDTLLKGFHLNQFPSLKQIIYSPWGYGLSHPKQPEGGMSYMVGVIHLGVMLMLIPLLWLRKGIREIRLIGGFALAAFFIIIFFMLEISLPLWDFLPLLSYVQAPVRLLIVPVFASSIVVAMFIKYLPFKKLLFIFLIALVFYANRNHLGTNQEFNPGEGFYQDLAKKSTSTSFDEHLPIWVERMKVEPSEKKFSFIQGGGEVEVLENKSAKVLANIEATGSSKVRFNQYYFPGWEIEVDNKKINFDYLSKEEKGLPVFNLEQGNHKVLAEFKNTKVRNIADAIAFLSVVIWGGLLCKLLISKKF